MTDVWQTTKRADVACVACGRRGTCTVSPDGTAFKCWKDGGKIHLHTSGKPGANVSKNLNGTDTYIGKAFREKAGTRGKAFTTAEAAIGAAGRGIAGGKLSAVWSYADAKGAELLRMARFNCPDGKKEFRPVHRTGAGWKIGDPPGLLPLYRRNEIQTDGTVWVSEGEKATDAAHGLELLAVTSAHGSSGSEKTDWAPLAGREVFILPDNDESGRKYARSVAAILAKLKPPALVKIVALPGLPEGGDIVEYIEARDSLDTEAIRGSIINLAGAIQFIDSTEMAREPWPDPLPLPAGLPDVMPFDFSLLPDALHGWIKDISDRMQCPPDYCADHWG